MREPVVPVAPEDSDPHHTITNRLGRLVAAGLLTRDPAPHSRRTIRVAPTEGGRETTDLALHACVANEERLLAAMAHRDRKHSPPAPP